ncbi:MAG: 4-hydroxythreonine-4-phosphate dehydrogenase PdxA [Reyranellaceae bacterium]
MPPAGSIVGPVPPLAVTMGEPAGIGGELTLMAWRQRREGAPQFFALDDPDRLQALAERSGLKCPIRVIDRPEQTSGIFPDALPVLPVPVPLPDLVSPGKPDARAAEAVIASIDRAVELARGGQAAAVVTNPIHKATLYGAGFRFPGHTEYLLELAGGPASGHRAVMMLASEVLRVVPVTVHMALRRAVEALTTDMIVEAGAITAQALTQDFGIAAPRLAVAGLNPHAGEGGTLGDEEKHIVTPAIRALQDLGIAATGPHAPDTMFHAEARARYDAALCLYHDQALIPLKTLDFFGGVNVTLGLPFVRTSPDHGTAFDIAGSGRANPQSFIAALDLAARLSRHRLARS